MYLYYIWRQYFYYMTLHYLFFIINRYIDRPGMGRKFRFRYRFRGHEIWDSDADTGLSKKFDFGSDTDSEFFQKSIPAHPWDRL